MPNQCPVSISARCLTSADADKASLVCVWRSERRRRSRSRSRVSVTMTDHDDRLAPGRIHVGEFYAGF
jgi:ribosomal protein S27AE